MYQLMTKSELSLLMISDFFIIFNNNLKMVLQFLKKPSEFSISDKQYYRIKQILLMNKISKIFQDLVIDN